MCLAVVWFGFCFSGVLQYCRSSLRPCILEYFSTPFFFLRQSHLSLGWPRTYWPTCLCLLSTRVKGVFHHSPLQTSVVIFCVRLSLVEPSCPGFLSLLNDPGQAAESEQYCPFPNKLWDCYYNSNTDDKWNVGVHLPFATKPNRICILQTHCLVGWFL